MAEGTAPKLSRDYFRLFAASTISNLGDGIAIIAYPWLASAVTRSGLLIALVVVVQRLPWLLFSLPAGVITDRGDRRRLMILADLLRLLLTAAVIALIVFGFPVFWIVYTVVFLMRTRHWEQEESDGEDHP